MQSNSVLITGTSRGLGKALKDAFSAKGYDVLAHRRDIHGDLRDKKTLFDLVAWAADISVLVNCAGAYHSGGLLEISEEDLREVIEVDLLAPILLTKALWPVLVRNEGTLININSVAGRLPIAKNEIAYRVAKYGLTGFSYTIGHQGVEDNVRVLDFPFGGMNTSMIAGRENLDAPECQPEVAASLIIQMMENNILDNDKIRHSLTHGNGQMIDNGYLMKDGGKRTRPKNQKG